MKAVWSGSISFGLVTIPIRLYSAIQTHVFGFKLLCKKCHTPIHYKRWCEQCKKEVAWDDIVKGIEIKKDKYLILTQQLIKSLKPKKTDTIEIVEFVDSALIEPIYFDNHYFIAPAGADKAYALFQRALKETHKAAVGQFVMRDKEYACTVQSYGTGLLLSTLNYAYEIRSLKNIAELKHKQPAVNAQELKLAKQFIAALTKKDFDISAFKDTFVQELKKLINKKQKGKLTQVAKEVKLKAPKTHPTLMQSLRESLEEARIH